MSGAAANLPPCGEGVARMRDGWGRHLRLCANAQLHANAVGMPFEFSERLACEDTPEQRQALYEELWQKGGFHLLFSSYADLLTNKEANRTLADFVRGKIRETVRDPIGGSLRPSRAGDVLVLARRLTRMQALEDALEAAGLRFTVEGGKSFFDRQEVHETLAALLKLIGHVVEGVDGEADLVARPRR